MPNATELSEAGVSFAKGSDITSLLDIKFESSGLMTIPCLTIKRDTETILRNLIAYEKQSSDVQLSKYFSHYDVFMNNLIDSEKYVNLLRQKGITVNLMGDDKNLAIILLILTTIQTILAFIGSVK
ncbi:hypothetical protein MTR67_016539 [Solanum verrucosum]|uniref:Uncharacterized protein n=1 Tax=Solanum verrucosum TaxID=315347 RepID=A0AAF0TL11_SOLVR|nr:hypothetical protein MTR67_016539 [Solanum verrucosum]